MAMTVVVDANVTLGLALPLPYSSHADRRIAEWQDEQALVAAPQRCLSQLGVVVELVLERRCGGHRHGVAGGVGNLGVVGVAQFEE